MRVYANCRVRRIFFSDRAYNDWELPSCLRVAADERHKHSSNAQQQQSAQRDTGEGRAQWGEEEKGQLSSALAVRVAEVMVL